MTLKSILALFRGTPDRDRFARDVMRAIRETDPASELSYDPGEFRIVRRSEASGEGYINLGNMFSKFAAMPRKERPAYLRGVVRTAFVQARSLPEDFDSARPDLRPKLWSRATVESIRLERLSGKLGGKEPNWPTLPIGEHLVAILAYDWPEAVQTLQEDDLAKWGVTVYEALEAARSNLRETTQGYAKIGDGFYSFMSGDSYDATRILLTDMIEGFEVKGRPVAMAPHRDALMVTGSEDEDGLRMLADLAEAGLAEPYSLTGTPLFLEDGEWRDWMPPSGHPLAIRFSNIRTRWIGPTYARQKELLDEVFEGQADRPFVATLSAIQRDDASLASYCVWGEGVDSLLPEADKVVFMVAGGGQPMALASWDRVREVVGHLMEPTEHYPARYRVRAFPDAGELARLGVAEM